MNIKKVMSVVLGGRSHAAENEPAEKREEKDNSKHSRFSHYQQTQESSNHPNPQSDKQSKELCHLEGKDYGDCTLEPSLVPEEALAVLVSENTDDTTEIADDNVHVDIKPVNSPRKEKSVSFMLQDDPLLEEPTLIDLNSLSRADLQARAEKLQHDLTEALITVSSERAIRRIKEKRVFKIAKELKKRTEDTACKKKQIVKFAEAINQAEVEAKVAADRHSMEMHSVLCAHNHEVARIRAEHDVTVGLLQQKLVQSNIEIQELQCKLAALGKSNTGKNQFTNRSHLIGWFLIAVVVSIASLYCASTCLDFLCAPMFPHTKLGNKDVIQEAPWWALPSFKEAAFSSVCGTRTRMRLIWANGTLTAVALRRVNADIELWTFPADKAEISSGKIRIKDSRGFITIEDPWNVK